jgi:DNA polymerase-3 subunit gamma/tau
MSSQVFYRKWRPKNFNTLAGQDHVVTVLRNTIKQHRISHAYLFCGPRGTGKTTSARVLAKTLNCLNPVDGEADNQCNICLSYDSGKTLDLIEMDAASNRGIDEIRSLREKVHFLPSQGAYKVYIVDEAHMLTEAAANAFLKTLEEPPKHVIFILCTTEAHKIPATIISRCQRLDFRRLTTKDIVSKLEFICEKENIQTERRALEFIGRSARGSLRDAENLLEQIAVLFNQNVSVENVRENLGLVNTKIAKDLVSYLLSENIPAALTMVGIAVHDGTDIQSLHHETIELLRTLLMIKSGATGTLDVDNDILNSMISIADKTSLYRIAKCLKHIGAIKPRAYQDSSLSLELAIIETSTEFDTLPTHYTAKKESPLIRKHFSATPTQKPNPISQSQEKESSDEPDQTKRTELPDTLPRTVDSAIPTEAWNNIIQYLRRQRGKRFYLGPLLKDCHQPFLDEKTMVLPFNHKSNMERIEAELEEYTCKSAVNEAMEKYLGHIYEIKLTLRESSNGSGSSSLLGKPMIRAARALGGKIIKEESITSNE